MNDTAQVIIMERIAQEKRDKAERFKYLNKYVKPGQIVFVGSSLMEQFPIYEFLQDFDVPLKIYNRGIGAYTTADLLAHMEECIFDLQPSRIFMNIGTNDLNDSENRIEELLKQLDTIIRQIKERLPETELNLQAYYPVNINAANNEWTKKSLINRTNEKIQEVNGRVEWLARQHQVRFLDLNAELYDEQGLQKAEFSIDGMHMYANGYKAIFDKLLPFLMERT